MKIDEYLRDKMARKPGAAKAYKRYLTYLNKWLDKPIEDLSVNEFLVWMRERGWANATQYIASCATRDYLRWAGLDGHPLLEEMPVVRKPSPRQRTISEEMFLQIVTAIDTSTVKGKRDYAMLCTLYDSSVRSTELCNIDLEKLNMEHRYFSVKTKGDRWEEKVFSKLTQNAIAAWLAVRPKVSGDHNRLFCSVGGIKPGEPFTREGLRAVVRDLGRKVGIKASPHDFRRGHTEVSHMNGVPQYQGMQQTGHRDQDVYRRFAAHGMRVRAKAWDPYFPTNCLLADGGHESIEISVKVD